MKTIFLPCFNPEYTLLGGQAFNWIRKDNCFYGVFQDFILKIYYLDNILHWESYPKINDEVIENLFRLDFDYIKMLEEILNYPELGKPVKERYGLRLLKQNFSQALVSFIISQNSNIPKIKRSLNLISMKVGKKITFDGMEFYLFPTLEELLELTEKDLLETGIGYRAKYLKKSIEDVLKNNLHLKISDYPYELAKKELLKLYGVGEKVADCVLVFSLAHDHITPIDLWAKRAITYLYDIKGKISNKKIQIYFQNRFKNYSSWVGQFLFEYFRTTKFPRKSTF